MGTLYHYVHCPYCVRVRMVLGYFGITYQSRVLAYNDEATPLSLTGVKMLPIFQDEQGKAMNESLDIIAKLDPSNQLHREHYESRKVAIEELLDQVASPVHNLAMPYWIWTPEFDDESRHYFETKKSKKRGPFSQLVHKQLEFIAQLEPLFKKIESQLKPYYQSEQLSLNDILIAAHLWGLYIVPEFQFPEKIHLYLQRVKKDTKFNYHQDFWKN